MGRRAARLAVMAVLGAIAAVAALGITSVTRGPVSAGTVELRLSPGGSGRTELVLPPLGRVTAPTHGAPLTVSAEVKRLDIEEVQSLVTGDDPARRLRSDAVSGFGKQLRRLVVRTVLLSAVVGAVAAALVPGRRWTDLPQGALGGVVGVSLLLGWAWHGYSPAAFEDRPRFEGALERAPDLLATIQRHVDDVEVVRDRIDVLGARIAELYTATAPEESADAAGAGTRILHVSDIHSNPLAIDVIDRLVSNFGVDAVLDTGDLTTFGNPIEARIADLLRTIEVPYLLVPGNHDSPAVRAALAASPNVQVLDGDVTRVGGVRILGVPDPTFTASNEISTADANAQKERRAPVVGRMVRRLDPDVLAVHDQRQADGAVGDVPLVVAGHTHERGDEEEDGTRRLTVGSTGATGLGSFTVETDLAYEAEVLHFLGGRLVAIDYVRLLGFGGSFVVDHTVVDAPDAPADEAAVPGSATSGG